ncbi:ABC-2 transporter permease [Clostridiaceae bacterium M8S5]|nr:ABC-2 transporter permease [Clostridiaceae bacterium M8S5]
MIRLLMRDIFLIRCIRKLIPLLIMIGIPIISLFEKAILIYPVVIFYLTYLSMYWINSYDDKNNSEVYFSSLPVKKEDVVISKYISTVLTTILIGGIALVVSNLTVFVIEAYNLYTIEGQACNGWSVLISLMLIMVYFSLYYPFYFRFGGKKLQLINSLITLIIIMSPAIIESFVKGTNFANWLGKTFSKYNANQISLLSVLGVIILYIISMILSQVLYKTRDL